MEPFLYLVAGVDGFVFLAARAKDEAMAFDVDFRRWLRDGSVGAREVVEAGRSG